MRGGTGVAVSGDVARAVSTVRDAARSWGRERVTVRVAAARALRERIVERLDDVTSAVMTDAGKTRSEALLTDVLATLEIMLANESLAPRALAPETRAGTLILPHSTATVTREPWGVVLVIGPYNNPFQLTLLPAITALLAGNGVIIKPSEKSPATAAMLDALLRESGFPGGVVALVEGGARQARELIEARPDLIFFTGGERGGRAVMEAAAAHPVPVMLELGGKNPMVVFGDADLERACQAAVYGAFAHDGQHCVSVGRLCVEDTVYEDVCRAVAEGARRLVRGRDVAETPDTDAAARARAHVASALDAGARLLTAREGDDVTLPAVVADVTPDMTIATEETFGPALPIMRFTGNAEAREQARMGAYGLNASIWTRDLRRGRRLARDLDTGSVFINGTLTNAGHPWMPFGGVGRSGFGRYHGLEGIRAFTRSKSTLERPARPAADINWFPFGDDIDELTTELVRLRYGASRGLLGTIAGWLRLWRLRAARFATLAKATLRGGKRS